MSKPLVIVESPAKARTIARFLGSGYVVESSVGHIRDLPRGADEVPAAYKGEPWARLGVDVDHDFKPLYVVAKNKKQIVTNLKRLLKDADELYLATDEDREGESIAWHLLEVLSPPKRVPVKRMVFHEITAPAIQAALANPRDLDSRLVDAQEARRILDRLYGYEVSPVLWRRSCPSCRRDGCRAWPAASWWSGSGPGCASAARPTPASRARSPSRAHGDHAVRRHPGQRRRHPPGHGQGLRRDGPARPTGGQRPRPRPRRRRRAWPTACARRRFTVRSVDEKPYRRSPYPPFMTSTLQQEAGRKLRFTAQRTMSTAQRLYENGYITYMRTDSTTLSETAVTAARRQAAELYGPDYVPDQPRRYDKKVKNAQEAHEAIRPAGDSFRTPDQVARELGADERALYELIWKRTVASQMADARGRSMQVRLGATSSGRRGRRVLRRAARPSSSPGSCGPTWRAPTTPRPTSRTGRSGCRRSRRATPSTRSALEPKDHTTQPPARYTEASLVKALEEMGVGRPSTYASILGTIQDRGYVWKKGSALVPSLTAFAVVTLLEQHFAHLVDYAFTARMEDDLDDIANGGEKRVPWLSRFYFGNGTTGLKAMVNDRLDEIDPREVNSIPIGKDAEGREIVVRVGKYGPYLPAGRATRRRCPRASPPTSSPSSQGRGAAGEAQRRPGAGHRPRHRPARDRAGGPLRALRAAGRRRRAGPRTKPRTASLFKSMALETLTLDDALQLLTIPRVLGHDPADGQEISAQNGRYGPYVKKGTDSRSLEDEERLLTVTLDEALALLAGPKARGGRAAAAEPLRELGPDPVVGGAGHRAGGPVRPLRHRRHRQRVPPGGRLGGGDHARAGGRAAPGPAGAGPGQAPQDDQDHQDGQEGARPGPGGPAQVVAGGAVSPLPTPPTGRPDPSPSPDVQGPAPAEALA